ncbi:MAG: hypothetical protein COB50_02690 [Thiotrichales bacterium]|nr:MAG: hypothetical protein COB50_02690 [Thiotrichales bacterium]
MGKSSDTQFNVACIGDAELVRLLTATSCDEIDSNNIKIFSPDNKSVEECFASENSSENTPQKMFKKHHAIVICVDCKEKKSPKTVQQLIKGLRANKLGDKIILCYTGNEDTCNSIAAEWVLNNDRVIRCNSKDEVGITFLDIYKTINGTRLEKAEDFNSVTFVGKDNANNPTIDKKPYFTAVMLAIFGTMLLATVANKLYGGVFAAVGKGVLGSTGTAVLGAVAMMAVGLLLIGLAAYGVYKYKQIKKNRVNNQEQNTLQNLIGNNDFGTNGYDMV